MTHLRWSTLRWYATGLALVAAALAYGNESSAHSYYVQATSTYSNTGCTYDSSGRELYAWATASNASGTLCNAILVSNSGQSAYSYCGSTQPTTTYGVCAYEGSTQFTTEGAAASTTTWGNGADYQLQPAYNSSGVSCGANSYVDCDGIGYTDL
jgi:hypothetical protein